MADSLNTTEYRILAPDGSEWMRVSYRAVADAINQREFNGGGSVDQTKGGLSVGSKVRYTCTINPSDTGHIVEINQSDRVALVAYDCGTQSWTFMEALEVVE